MGSHLTTETQRHKAFVWQKKNSVSLCLCGEFIPSLFFIITKRQKSNYLSGAQSKLLCKRLESKMSFFCFFTLLFLWF